jgi:hypothetical protein
MGLRLAIRDPVERRNKVLVGERLRQLHQTASLAQRQRQAMFDRLGIARSQVVTRNRLASKVQKRFDLARSANKAIAHKMTSDRGG